jgi:hypothetical protein
MAKALSVSPPPTTDEVDMLFRQLMEIQAIAVVQLAECARWHRSDSTPCSVWAGTGWQGPNKMPSMTRVAPPPLTDFTPKPRCGDEAHMSSPWHAGGPIRWARSLSGVRGSCASTSPAARGNTVVTLRGQGLR